ncbi:MAG TPA: hypothetical protein VHV29_03235 [Terriglobales bacterium]|jgi:hypothetical protein|nr:hypothetical protein [Terriglobales bacterium]
MKQSTSSHTIFRPSDQINLAAMPAGAKIPRHHHVALASQVEIGVFLAATPGAQMGRSVGVHPFGDKSVKSAEKSLGDVA